VSASPSVSASPTTSPPKAKTKSSPDALGARRVIPVPKSLAQQQIHQLLAVDGQATLLDAGPGTRLRPLLLVLHGLGEDAVEMRHQTGFTALAALTGFDVAYPNAPQDPGPPASTATLTRASVQVPAANVTPSPSPSTSPSASVTPTRTPSHSPSPSPSPTRTATPTPSRIVTTPPTPKPSPRPPKKTARPTPAPKKRPSPLVAGTRAWNAGTCCALALRNDVGYLVDVVHAVAAAVPVDVTRVYIVGFSNGGMMALRAICSAPEVFAAAGSVSGPFLGSTCDKAVWRHIAAAPDPIVPAAGGISPGAPSLGVVRDWCGCTWPATTTERARFGPFASVYISPTGGHTWPTPDSTNWSFDPERDLWGYVSRFHL
jgi:predicted esterase